MNKIQAIQETMTDSLLIERLERDFLRLCDHLGICMPPLLTFNKEQFIAAGYDWFSSENDDDGFLEFRSIIDDGWAQGCYFPELDTIYIDICHKLTPGKPMTGQTS